MAGTAPLFETVFTVYLVYRVQVQTVQDTCKGLSPDFPRATPIAALRKSSSMYNADASMTCTSTCPDMIKSCLSPLLELNHEFLLIYVGIATTVRQVISKCSFVRSFTVAPVDNLSTLELELYPSLSCALQRVTDSRFAEPSAGSASRLTGMRQ
jgi:hypothetical protein